MNLTRQLPSIDDDHHAVHRRSAASRVLGAVGLMMLGGLALLSGMADGHEADVPTSTGVADTALAELVGPDPQRAAAALPAGFSERFGYTPAVVDGRLVDPLGDCSSPIPLPDRFQALCRSHDLGYDLLRQGAEVDGTVPRGARAALDRRLIDDMRESCDSFGCYAAAEVSRVALALNTWRQDGQAPQPESGVEIATSMVRRTAHSLAGDR